jgi:hypothetical protein
MSVASSDGDVIANAEMADRDIAELFGDDDDSLPYPRLRPSHLRSGGARESSFSSSSSQTSDSGSATGSEEPPLVRDEEGEATTATALVQELLNTSINRTDRKLQW